MVVTKIEAVNKTKYKVFLDEQFAFVLYKGELSRYKLCEDCEVAHGLYEQIKQEVVLKRAKLRALHLLSAMDRTEEQLRTKLRQNLYTEDVIEGALQYVKSFGYMKDEDYARRFITGKQNVKSKREIKAALYQKGISKETIEEAMNMCYEDTDEKDAIRRILEKKQFNAGEATEAEKKKIFDYLIRKGFRYEDVRQLIQVSFWNT